MLLFEPNSAPNSRTIPPSNSNEGREFKSLLLHTAVSGFQEPSENRPKRAHLRRFRAVLGTRERGESWAAGPILAALTGAAAGGAVGGLAGGLVGLGIPEYEAKRYEGAVRNGNILISVHTEDSDERDRAKKVFERANAKDISYTAEARP